MSFQERVEATPIKRGAEPEEIAAVIAFVASPESSYVLGAAIDVTGGYTTV
jgi:NAD(P)-dependent dehydrogenase (short-subunit alcohol dehydrogenase family)